MTVSCLFISVILLFLLRGRLFSSYIFGFAAGRCFGFALHGVGHRHTAQDQLAVDTIPKFYKLLYRLPLFFPCDIEKGEDTRMGHLRLVCVLLQRIEWFSSSIRAEKYADEVYHSAPCVEKPNKIIAHFRLVCRERS